MESHTKHTTLFKTHTCPIRILPLLVALAAFLHAGAENAEDKDAPNTVDTMNIYSLKEVEVSASMRNRFASPTSHTVAKMQLGDLENPQVYLNKKYYNGWSTVSPQRLFNVSIGAEYRF